MLVLVSGLMAGGLSAGEPEVRLRSRLTGAATGSLVPSGSADFRAKGGASRLNVQVEDVALPVGTQLTVKVNGMTAGTITLSASPVTPGGELELNTKDGQVVPSAKKGDVVTVFQGDGSAVVSGVL